LPRLQIQLGCDVTQFVTLGDFQAVSRALVKGARVKQICVQEEAIEIVGKIVMLHVIARADEGVVLVEGAKPLVEPAHRLL
jgi:hypothetical protein